MIGCGKTSASIGVPVEKNRVVHWRTARIPGVIPEGRKSQEDLGLWGSVNLKEKFTSNLMSVLDVSDSKR